MSETRPFLFGKLPTFGDFLSRGLAEHELEAWDRRCTATVRATSARMGDSFAQTLEAVPPRGFLLEPGGGERHWQAGCAAFSCDRVGRPFLFVLGFAGGRLLRDIGESIAASLEPCLYDAFLHRRDPASILDAAVNASVERHHAGYPGRTLMRSWQADWAAA